MRLRHYHDPHVDYCPACTLEVERARRRDRPEVVVQGGVTLVSGGSFDLLAVPRVLLCEGVDRPQRSAAAEVGRRFNEALPRGFAYPLPYRIEGGP